MRMIIIYFKDEINTILKMRSFLIAISFFTSLILSDCNEASDSSRTVIAGGSLTEITYFLEQENKLIAVDVTSNYPKKTRELDSIGYVRALSTEGLLSLSPTLILGEDDMGPPLVIDQLALTGVDIRIVPEEQTSEGILSKIRCLSSILGVSRSFQDQKISLLAKDVNKLKKTASKNSKNPKRVMLILNMQGTSPIVAGRNTSGDSFIKMTGAKNVVTSFEGWKPVNSEAIISYNPDYILITERGMGSFADIESLSKEPSLKFTAAAKNKNILSEDGMAMLGFGVRTLGTALNFSKIFSEE